MLITFFSQNSIAVLEMLDEVEELELVLDHYVIAWGVKVSGHDDEAQYRHLLEWGLHQNGDGASATED